MRSAQNIKSSLEETEYITYIIEIKGTEWNAHASNGKLSAVDRNDFSFEDNGKRVKPDYAYITIHGTPGENGILEGYFDLIRLPYSTSDVLVEAMTFNKFVLNQYLRESGVNIAKSVLLRKGQAQRPTDEQILEKVGLPCFVKPNAGGSSFGVTKVKSKEVLETAIEKAMSESPEVIIESFMQGTEITCGCYKTKKSSVVFPITEVVTSNEFFDYNAKYNGQVKEITPARLTPETTERVQAETSKIYDILGCRGIIRIDYILTGEKDKEKINMLEINTTPGMTATSFIPQQVKIAGLSMAEVLSDIIEDSFC